MNLPTTPEGDVTPLAVARAVRGMSCADVGDVVGVTAARVSCWERGQGEPPTRAQWATLALRFGVPLVDLMGPAVPEREAWASVVAGRNRLVRGLLRR